jgi:hypothetical protein
MPLLETIATCESLVCQSTVAFETVCPFASVTVAVSCTVSPACSDALGGVTSTLAMGTGCTVIVAEPAFPSLDAKITADPAATAVTFPLPSTVATSVLLDRQLIARPLSAFPLASRGVAVSESVCPITSVAVGGETLTLATGTFVTVTTAVPLFPSLVAVIVAVPADTPVTTPLPFTVATELALDDQVTGRPGSALPFASVTCACSVVCAPTVIEVAAGLTTTELAGTGCTVTAAVPDFPSLVAVIVAEP